MSGGPILGPFPGSPGRRMDTVLRQVLSTEDPTTWAVVPQSVLDRFHAEGCLGPGWFCSLVL